MMPEKVGVRELKQNASAVLRRVKSGESLTITDRGRVVALLSPTSTSTYDSLVEQGVLTPARSSFSGYTGPLSLPNGQPLSDVLTQMRDEERY